MKKKIIAAICSFTLVLSLCFVLAGCNRTESMSKADALELLTAVVSDTGRLSEYETTINSSETKGSVTKTFNNVFKNSKNTHKIYNKENIIPSNIIYGITNDNTNLKEFYICNPIMNTDGLCDEDEYYLYKEWTVSEDKPEEGLKEKIAVTDRVPLATEDGMFIFYDKLKAVSEKIKNDDPALLNYTINCEQSLKGKNFKSAQMTVTATYTQNSKQYTATITLNIKSVSAVIDGNRVDRKLITSAAITETATAYSMSISASYNYSIANVAVPDTLDYYDFIN